MRGGEREHGRVEFHRRGACVVQADGVATTNFTAASAQQSVTIARATDVTAGTPGTATAIGVTPPIQGCPSTGIQGLRESHGFARATPAFGSLRLALAVFECGSVDDLEVATRNAEASGVWVQDELGTFKLLIVGGPSFLRDEFSKGFPKGVAVLTAVTMVQ